MVNTLYIVRGVSGSGKTTFAKNLNGDMHVEADMFFANMNGGVFDFNKLGAAHKWCLGCISSGMVQELPKLVVSNTFTRESELQPYMDLAVEFNYKVIVLIVENRHNGVSVHDVPEKTLAKQEARFSVKLR